MKLIWFIFVAFVAIGQSDQVQDSKYHLAGLKEANWYKSYQYCRNLNMHLVSIDDAAKNDEIVKIIKDRGYGNATFWTSGTNLGSIDVTYKYYWMGNGHKMMFNDWSIDQPNDPQHENCVALNHELNYKWDDQECDKILYSICEY